MAGRLYDKMRTKKPQDTLGREHEPPDLGEGEIILIDNVADYYLDFLPKGFKTGDKYTVPWDYDKHYPFCAPPFDTMWFEFRTTKVYDVDRIGVRVLGVELTQEFLDGQTDAFRQSLMDGHPDLLKTTRWLLYMDGYLEQSNGVILGPIATYVIGVAPDGKLATNDLGDHVYVVKSYDLTRAVGVQPLVVNPCLMAMSFMHTKNTRVLPVVPDLPRTKNQRKKDRKSPASKYYVLKIDPIDNAVAQRKVGARNSPEERSEAGLHIVRGHFADYTQGAGLFGRIHGKFWMQAHIRGNPEHGVTEKDYEIKAPK